MYKIYISTFGKKTIRIKGGVPIEVGAGLRQNFRYKFRDDSGDNISIENPYYGELSGMYWVWKNTMIHDDDIIGFCHYNKCLNISKKKCNTWLNQFPQGMITINPIKIRNHPYQDEVDAMIASLSEADRKVYYRLYDVEAASVGNTCRGGNMFICRGGQFKSYCQWLFPILQNARLIIGDKAESSPNMRRYCAYMGERLLSVYIEANHLPCLNTNVRYKKWWLPMIRAFVNRMHINRNSKPYKMMKKLFGYRSQYQNKIHSNE